MRLLEYLGHFGTRDEPDLIFSGPGRTGLWRLQPDRTPEVRSGAGPDRNSGLISLKCPKTNGNSCTEIKAKCNNIFNT